MRFGPAGGILGESWAMATGAGGAAQATGAPPAGAEDTVQV